MVALRLDSVTTACPPKSTLCPPQHPQMKKSGYATVNEAFYCLPYPLFGSGGNLEGKQFKDLI